MSLIRIVQTIRRQCAPPTIIRAHIRHIERGDESKVGPVVIAETAARMTSASAAQTQETHEEEEIRRLIEQLHENFTFIPRALRSLIQIGLPAIPALVDALRPDQDSSVRFAVARAL